MPSFYFSSNLKKKKRKRQRKDNDRKPRTRTDTHNIKEKRGMCSLLSCLAASVLRAVVELSETHRIVATLQLCDVRVQLTDV